MATDSSFILGVDLDGVCGDYTGALRQVVAQQRGGDLRSLPLERSWDFREWGLSPTEFERLHQAAVLEHRIFRTMPAFDGVAEVLWRLSDAGVWIRIITHRLFIPHFHETAVAQTVRWLDYHGVPYWDLCFMRRKGDVGADHRADTTATTSSWSQPGWARATALATERMAGTDAP